MPLELSTERLRLRGLTPGDADALWPFVSDPALPHHMTWEAHTDLAQTHDFVARTLASEDSVVRAITLLDGTLVGVIGLHGIVRTFAAWSRDTAELGYWVGAPHQGHGFVTEAARAVVADAFTDLGLRTVSVGAITANEASCKVIAKVGFRRVGVQRDYAWRHGQWWDHALSELTVEEWRDLA